MLVSAEGPSTERSDLMIVSGAARGADGRQVVWSHEA
jgi:hypothetical protein